jgi:hypothetical protein
VAGLGSASCHTSTLPLSHQLGRESELDGVDQQDRIDGMAFYIEVRKFVTPIDQILFGFSRGIDTENGFKMGN